MNYKLTSKILSSIVMLGGIIVMLGWVFNISYIISIAPTLVSMKFITALSFFFSGLMIFLLSFEEKNDWIDYFTTIISFTLFLLMIIFIISLFSGISTGIETLFVTEAPGTIRTTIPGVPSITTIFCFILIGLSRLINLIKPESKKIFFWTGLPISIIGVIAIIGYILNIPLMYYTISNYTPMALNTSLLFIILGLSLIFLTKDNNNHLTSSIKKSNTQKTPSIPKISPSSKPSKVSKLSKTVDTIKTSKTSKK